jgi:hypothetical protein
MHETLKISVLLIAPTSDTSAKLTVFLPVLSLSLSPSTNLEHGLMNT